MDESPVGDGKIFVCVCECAKLVRNGSHTMKKKSSLDDKYGEKKQQTVKSILLKITLDIFGDRKNNLKNGEIVSESKRDKGTNMHIRKEG